EYFKKRCLANRRATATLVGEKAVCENSATRKSGNAESQTKERSYPGNPGKASSGSVSLRPCKRPFCRPTNRSTPLMRPLQNKAPVSGRSRRSYLQATEPQRKFRVHSASWGRCCGDRSWLWKSRRHQEPWCFL